MASTNLSVSDWKKKCQEEQESISQLLSNRIWDKFVRGTDDKYLFQKIALPLFGLPKKDAEDFGLNDEQKDLVNDIKDKCIKHNVYYKDIYVAVIFVFVRVNSGQQTFVPLIRVMTHRSEKLEDVQANKFIDHLGRVYESWWRYKEENTWDQSRLCVPKDGYYSSEQGIEFIDQSERGILLQAVDVGISAGGICSSVCIAAGTVMTFFPPTSIFGAALATAGTIAGTSCGGYGVVRSLDSLVDRSTHEQSISLTNSEARNHWLSTVTAALSVGTMASSCALQSIAKGGNLVSSTTRAAVTALNATSLSVSGIHVILSTKDFIEKENKTTLDFIQLSTTIFFFTHSVFTFKTASGIIKDAQKDVIMEMRKNVKPKERPAYDSLLQGTKENVEKGKARNMHGNAIFIKEMKQINDLNEFYSHFKVLPDGQLKINDELTMHARANTKLSKAQRDKVLSLSKQLSENKITMSDFNKEISDILKENRYRFDRQRLEVIEYLEQIFNVGDVSDINIGGKKLGNCKPEALDRLKNIVRNSFHDEWTSEILDELFGQFTLLPNEQLNINDELTIHPRAFTQMEPKEKVKILLLTKMLREKKITEAGFNSDISGIQKKYRIRFDRQRFEGIEYLREIFKVGDVSEINIGETKLGNCKPEVLDRLENVVRNSFHGDPDLIELANTFSKNQGVKNITEYCAAGEYVVRKVETEVKSLQQKNPNPTRGKGVKAKDHYKSIVVEELLNDGGKMNKLMDEFKNLCSVCDAANVRSPKFENSMAAANHYDKHRSFPKIDPNNNLSPERYFEIAEEMAGGPVTDTMWTQDGSSLCCTFFSEKYGATLIRYDNLANKTSVVATLYANNIFKQSQLIN